MTERLIEKLDRFGVEAEIKEMTPEIRRFAMIVRNDMLQVWPKRDWVGLTDEEIWGAVGRIGTSNSDVNPYQTINDARAIEKLLKEKNEM